MRRAFAVGVVCLVAGGAGCKKKVTEAECASIVDRYARLVVTERFPDASASTVQAEQDRERQEAQRDENFRNCTTEVSAAEYDCAMHAASANAIEKCLE
jgi:hypothetical protein